MRRVDGSRGAAAPSTTSGKQRGEGYGHCHPFRKGVRHASVSNVFNCVGLIWPRRFPLSIDGTV
ncbi:hypothetical protein A33K_12743 [Burkholderia humptydooensis MSMB43]|uniref:Uncharacterized protein n=1 Tax=Burkholderia humptydooensis MSMB43 TaxID=441157 RepID=A0ABN0GAD4_9BURK|nr:hypothetical protein A33K_12743 [Burkholderia humptydooensis MSMB43]